MEFTRLKEVESMAKELATTAPAASLSPDELFQNFAKC